MHIYNFMQHIFSSIPTDRVWHHLTGFGPKSRDRSEYEWALSYLLICSHIKFVFFFTTWIAFYTSIFNVLQAILMYGATNIQTKLQNFSGEVLEHLGIIQIFSGRQPLISLWLLLKLAFTSVPHVTWHCLAVGRGETWVTSSLYHLWKRHFLFQKSHLFVHTVSSFLCATNMMYICRL